MAKVTTDHKVTEASSASAAKTAIIAGGGRIPSLLAAHLTEQGNEPFIAMIDGEACDSLTSYEHTRINTAAIGKLVSTLEREKIEQVVIVGSVAGRPNWRDFRPDLATLKIIKKIISGLRGGDDGLLRGVISVIEDAGVKVVGVHDLMPELTVPKGIIAGRKPSAAIMNSVHLGATAAQALGELDAGQACVVIGKRIVAMEGAEGTDEMLERIADLRKRGKLPTKKGGVLVKLCKPQQDKRVDLPTIGINTIQNAAKAKLAGIAVHAGNALIVDIQAAIDAAQSNDVFVVGIEPKQKVL